MKKGSVVRLTSKPTGYESGRFDVNIGDTFKVEYIDGCCLCVSNDTMQFTANKSRFENVKG